MNNNKKVNHLKKFVNSEERIIKNLQNRIAKHEKAIRELRANISLSNKDIAKAIREINSLASVK